MYKLNLERRSDFKELLRKQGSARMTPPTGFSDGFNFIYTEGGNLRLRAGFKKLNASSLNAPITGLKQVPWNVSALMTVCAAGTGIHLWNTILDTFITVWNGQTPGVQTVFDAYGGNLLFANGVDPFQYYNGSVCKEIPPPTDGWYGGLNPEMVAIWKDRAWVAVGPMVYASDLQVPYDFVGGTATQFPTGDDNPVRCLIEAFDKLWVIKDRSVGYITQTVVANLDGTRYYGWSYTKAYSSVFGTPSRFGACGCGESAYYGAPDGLFEITNTGREGLGNFNTQRLEVLGIGNYFDPAHTDHLFFNSFEKLIVATHLGRNEIWFFVGRNSNSIDTILVYCRALKRWTQFTVPACQSACSFITEAYQRTVAIGTEDGFVAIADQSFDGKDLGVDYVGNSFLDFMWAGDSPTIATYNQGLASGFYKSWRLFAPVIQGSQFKYSTAFDEARPGVTNVPVNVGSGVDQIAHEVPIELNGRGFWLKTRISGVAGQWPLEIAGLVAGMKLVRQRGLSTVTPLGTWSLPSTVDFTKTFYCVADWTQSFGLLRFYSGNKSLIGQGGNFSTHDIVVDNTITLSALRGGGFVVAIIGIYLATETFQASDPWALPTNPFAVNYYAGGSFINNPDLYSTIISLGTPLSNGTDVIVRYLYIFPEIEVPGYTPIVNYPWIQKVDTTTLVPSIPLKGTPDFLLYEFWKNKRLFALNTDMANAAIKFLWQKLLDTTAANVLNFGPLISFSTIVSGLIGPIGSTPTSDNVSLATSFQAGLATVLPTPVTDVSSNPAAVLPVADNVAITTKFESLADLASYGLTILVNIIYEGYGAYVGIQLNWPKSVMQQIDAIAFAYQGSQSGQVILVSLVTEGGDYYFAGFPDLSSNRVDIGISLPQFYRASTIFWDGIRVVNPLTLSYYSASGSKSPVVAEILDQAFMSPEGDLLHSLIELDNPVDSTGAFIASWLQALIDTSGVNYNITDACGVSFLYKAGSGPTTPTVTVTMVSTAGTSTYGFSGVPNNKWIRQTILWADFSGVTPSGVILSITVRVASSPVFQLADFCFCDAGRLPYKLRYSAAFNPVNSLVWSVQDNPGYKVYYLYDTLVTYQIPGHGTIGPGETLKPITLTRTDTISSKVNVIDTGALGQFSLVISKLAIALKTSNAFPYTWPSLIGYLPGDANGLFSGGVVTCYAPLLPAWIAKQIIPALDHVDASLVSRKNLIIEGAAAYKARYNIDGPIVPANSCVATEALGLFGGFNTFDWYRKWPNAEVAVYHFNETLKDASQSGFDLTWHTGTPDYVVYDAIEDNQGNFYPFKSAIQMDGTNYAHGATALTLGNNFTLMVCLTGDPPASDHLILAQKYAGSGYGWRLKTGLTGESKVILETFSSLGSFQIVISGVLDGLAHVIWFTCSPGVCKGYLDNTGVASEAFTLGNIDNSVELQLGGSALYILSMLAIETRVMGSDQIAMIGAMFQGNPNVMSLIPDATTGVGQYLAFLNTAKYRGITGDTSVDSYLDNFVTWLDQTILTVGTGKYKPVQWFNQYTWGYPSEINYEYHGLILQGLVYYYWYSGSSVALTWINRLMDDIRLHGLDPVTNTFLSRG